MIVVSIALLIKPRVSAMGPRRVTFVCDRRKTTLVSRPDLGVAVVFVVPEVLSAKLDAGNLAYIMHLSSVLPRITRKVEQFSESELVVDFFAYCVASLLSIVDEALRYLNYRLEFWILRVFY